MSDLKVKTESLPSRCEICHQSDCFDALTNSCSRCLEIDIHWKKNLQLSVYKITPTTIFSVMFGMGRLGLKTGLIIAVLPLIGWLVSAEDAEVDLVIAVLALIGGPLSGLLFGFCFSMIAVAFNLIENLKRRNNQSDLPVIDI